MVQLSLLCLTLGAGGCIDIRDYAGLWSGNVVTERAVRQGFAEDVRVDPLQLEEVTMDNLSAQLTTSDGRFEHTRLVRITKASADELADISFGAGSLQTFLTYAPVTEADGKESGPAMILLSLFSDDRIQLRVIRGNDLYGVFNLHRR